MVTTKEAQEVINRRQEIVVAYCEKMGWGTDYSKLTMDQIMEIRSQENWKEVPHLVYGES
jgi:hypothetical protein